MIEGGEEHDRRRVGLIRGRGGGGEGWEGVQKLAARHIQWLL